MPALPPCIIEPIWQQFAALLPMREVDAHPLGCHHAQDRSGLWRTRSVASRMCEVVVRFLVVGKETESD